MLTFNLPRNLMSLVFLFLLFAADSRIKNRERRNLRCRKCQSQRWMGRNGRRTNTKSMYIHSSSPWFSPLCRWSFDTIKIEKPFYGKYKIENKHEPISVQLGVSLVPPSERASQTDRNGEAINFMVENFMRQLRCCDYLFEEEDDGGGSSYRLPHTKTFLVGASHKSRTRNEDIKKRNLADRLACERTATGSGAINTKSKIAGCQTHDDCKRPKNNMNKSSSIECYGRSNMIRSYLEQNL